MKSLILIPSYLWKNTFKRWFENPVSPLSKILVPSLLGLLATLVLVFFAEAEVQLSKKLASSNTYDVLLTEQVVALDNRLATELSLADEKMWLSAYNPDSIIFLRQIFVDVKWGRHRSKIPVFVYGDALPELQTYRKDIDAPTIWLMHGKAKNHGRHETIEIRGIKTTAVTCPIPNNLPPSLNADTMVAIPIEIALPFLREGFSSIIYARFKSHDEVRNFVTQANAYYHSERRNVQILSALEILDALQQLRRAQTYFRLGIVVACGLILALILGTIAWLEYRQEAYLLALLRSFGTPRSLLVFHGFLENCLLVSIGIFTSFYTWKPIYNLIKTYANEVTMRPMEEITLPSADANIILFAGVFGVALAMIPVAFGLRKQPGLILQ